MVLPPPLHASVRPSVRPHLCQRVPPPWPPASCPEAREGNEGSGLHRGLPPSDWDQNTRETDGGGAPWPGHPPGARATALRTSPRPACAWPRRLCWEHRRPERLVACGRDQRGTRTGEPPPPGPRPSHRSPSPALTHPTSSKVRTLRAGAAQSRSGGFQMKLALEVGVGGALGVHCRPRTPASSSVSPLYLHPASPSCPPRELPSARLLGAGGRSRRVPAQPTLPCQALQGARPAHRRRAHCPHRRQARLCVRMTAPGRRGTCLGGRSPFPN